MFGDNSKEGLPQLDQMRQGVDYKIDAKLRSFVVSLRPLTIDEISAVMNKVMDQLLALPEHLRHAVGEDILKAKEMLHLAATSDVGMEDSRLGRPLLARMTTDEIYHLYKQYQLAVAKANPCIEELPKQVLIDMVNVLKKSFGVDRAIYIGNGKRLPVSDIRRLTHGQLTWWVIHSIASDELEIS